MKRAAVLLAALALGGCGESVFTVCADPDNMPFSNARGEGFENKLAEVVASDLGKELRYVWWKQRRGWIRNTLGEGKCDAWMGVPSALEAVATTRPYYRTSFVFVTRADASLAGLTLDDPRLRTATIGVQLVGDDGANPPPAAALGRRGLTKQVRGYMLYGDDRSGRAGDIVRAVANKEIDVAAVWGPLAAWEATRSQVPLRTEPVTPWMDEGRWQMVFDISVGVARDNVELRAAIDKSLNRNRAKIGAILTWYKVPLSDGG